MANVYNIIVTIILCIIGIIPSLGGFTRLVNPIKGARILGIELIKEELDKKEEEESLSKKEEQQDSEERAAQTTEPSDGENVPLRNEIGGSGGNLCASGLVMIIGGFVKKLTATSIIIAIVIFWSYAIGRIYNWIKDGNPGKKIVQGLVMELLLGSLAVVALVLHCQATDFCES